ncbi:MAG: 6-hydroxymethylpterin diphosphokinase MptE-like protein, partial [bacterium]
FRTLVSEYRQVTGHSLFDPQRDADKKFKPEDFNEEDRVVLLGFGFGYEVRRLIEIESEKNISIIVIEPYVSVFKKALETVDLTDIIEKRKVVISFCVEPTELQYALLANVSHMNLPRFNVRVLPHATLYPDIFHIVGLARRELMTFITFNMVTGILAGPIFQNNLIMNFIVALKNPGIIELQDKFKNLPIFIVAPGPSLDANADMLKRVKGKALIIACDTATRILLRHGIEPDAIATIDFQPANFFKLRGIDTSFAYLFPALEVTPHLPLNHNGRMFNYYHSQLSSKVFDPILGEKGLISTGGSVLTDAFNIALSLGGDPIILVGVDLGFPGMKWYSEGSFDNGKFTRNLNDKKVEIIEVEDIHGNPMPTYRSFYEFIKWFRKRIEMTDAKVIDATEGGAKIEGAEIMSLSDAIDKYVTDDSDPRKILSDAYESFSPPPINTALEKIDEFIKDYGEIMGEMRKSAKSCKRALEILERSKVIEGNKELIRLLMRVKDSKQYLKNEKIDSRLGFLTPMMEKLMAEIFYHTQDESLPKRDQYAKLVSLDMDFYEKVIKGAENMKLHMESIRDEILLEEDHEEYV